MHWIQPLDRASPVTLTEQITQQVRRAIERGRLLPGERLPPILALSLEYEVTTGTVGRAMKALADEGWIVTLPSGSYIADAEDPDDIDTATPAAVARLAGKVRQLQRRLLAVEMRVYGRPPRGPRPTPKEKP